MQKWNALTRYILSISISLTCAGITAGQLSIVDQLPKQNLPIKVEVKNADSDDWMSKLELEVTNTGSKPIHHVNIWLIFDVTSNSGNPYGHSFRFGDGKFYSTNRVIADKDDASISPSNKHVFKITDIPEWELQLSWLVRSKSAELNLGLINFGDGTVLMPCMNAKSPQVRVCSQTTTK